MGTALAPAPPTASTRSATAYLRSATVFFTVAVLLHNGDHLRRGGDSVAADVFWLGSAAILIEIAVVVLVCMRHPTAPLVAAAVGLQLAVGYLAVHFTPERGWFSDSFVEGGASALSIAAASLETVAALVLCLAGVVAFRRLGWPAARRTADTLSLRAALAHPVVLAMTVGNAFVFVGSLATR